MHNLTGTKAHQQKKSILSCFFSNRKRKLENRFFFLQVFTGMFKNQGFMQLQTWHNFRILQIFKKKAKPHN